jgi:hypothetical protein
VIRSFGKVLRLVGISSPEDAEAKKTSAADPPSWKTAKPSAVETKPGE